MVSSSAVGMGDTGDRLLPSESHIRFIRGTHESIKKRIHDPDRSYGALTTNMVACPRRNPTDLEFRSY